MFIPHMIIPNMVVRNMFSPKLVIAKMCVIPHMRGACLQESGEDVAGKLSKAYRSVMNKDVRELLTPEDVDKVGTQGREGTSKRVMRTCVSIQAA